MRNHLLYIICLATIIIFILACAKTDPISKERNNTNWIEISVIDSISAPRLYFINENIGFVTGYVYYESLTTQYDPYIDLNRDTIIIYDNSLLSTIPEQPKFPLWKTKDGGTTWYPIKGFFKTSIKDIYFIDEFTGFVITEYEGVFKTTDGGESWYRIFGSTIQFHSSGGNSFAYPTEVCFYNQDNGFIYTKGLTEQNLYLFTKDGGNHWDFKYLSFKGRDYIFPENNKNIGFAANNSKIVKTKNGGLTWTTVAEGLSFPRFSFMDINVGLYNDGRKLYRTIDGGKSFKLVYDFKDDYLWDFYGTEKIVIIKNNYYFLVDCKIIRFKDTCSTFENLLAPDYCYRDISFPSERVGYAITGNGVLFKYSGKE